MDRFGNPGYKHRRLALCIIANIFGWTAALLFLGVFGTSIFALGMIFGFVVMA